MRPSDKGTRARNQRVSNARQRRQQNILEVRVRSRTAKHHRNRRVLVVTAKIALVLVLCASLYLGVSYGSRRLFFENPDYQLRTITVHTDGTLQREQVLKTAELRDGVNIFGINLALVHDRLQQLPQVDEVQVLRKMPGEIDVRIVERKPVAWLTSGKEVLDPFTSESAFLVDARGVLMKQKKLLPEYLGLPLISGCSTEGLEAGKLVESYDARAALELLRLSTGSFMQTRFQIRQIDMSKGYCLIVTDRNGTRVTFGFDRLDFQLQRLEQFLVHADDAEREIATVNLLVQRNIPVTFTQTATEVINATIDPNDPGTGGPRILKAIPLTPDDVRPGGATGEKSQAHVSASPMPVRKAVAVKPRQGKEKKNGE